MEHWWEEGVGMKIIENKDTSQETLKLTDAAFALLLLWLQQSNVVYVVKQGFYFPVSGYFWEVGQFLYYMSRFNLVYLSSSQIVMFLLTLRNVFYVADYIFFKVQIRPEFPLPVNILFSLLINPYYQSRS